MSVWKLTLLFLCASLVSCWDNTPAAASTPPKHVLLQCARDIDCKGDRICESGGCQAPAAPSTLSPSLATTVAEKSKHASALSSIASPDVIGTTVEYFEKVAGLAREQFGDERTYLVEGCEVLTIVKRGEVRAVGMNLSKKCSLDLNAFLPNFHGKFPPANKLTMPAFQRLAGKGVEYFVPCFDCGTSMDPITYAHWAVSHADQVFEVRIETQAVPEKVAAAIDQESIDFDFNCKPNKLESLARSAPPAGLIQSILIGHELPLDQCR